MTDADFELSGASSLRLEGSAEDITLDASGASRAYLEDLTINDTRVNLSGASQATVNAGGQISGDLSGASLLEYLGNPSIGNFTTSGASLLRPK